MDFNAIAPLQGNTFEENPWLGGRTLDTSVQDVVYIPPPQPLRHVITKRKRQASPEVTDERYPSINRLEFSLQALR